MVRLHTHANIDEDQPIVMYFTLRFADSGPSVAFLGSFGEDRIIGVGGEDRQTDTQIHLRFYYDSKEIAYADLYGFSVQIIDVCSVCSVRNKNKLSYF